MPHQLIYTSAPRGLQAGRSGYCTVARSRDLRERLILPIEQYSNYTHLVLPGQEATVRNPTIHLYRKHVISGKEYRILSRIVDAGADHTGRSNFVAHHLIFEDGWRGLPSPAVILRYWPGWKDRWDGDPTYIDEISPDELRTLGQTEGIPAAANDTYLEKGWDTPFTTYLQDGDSQADFEWMGTRDDPDPGKKIAELFGSGPEGQSKTLEKMPGLISAPDGDETRLLDIFAYALGRRSQAVEQEALGQARESLDNELRAIEQLAQRIAATVVEAQGKVDAYRQQYEARCETGDASRLYQNCLADYIKPAEQRTESAKAKGQDTARKAQAEHQAAKSQLESGQSPATGINPSYQNDLREIANGLAQTNHELTQGIQVFKDGLNEHNRAEQLRLEKEREERLKEQKIRLAHRGTPVGTEADFAGAYRGGSSAKSKRGVLTVVIYTVVALIIAVCILIMLPKSKPVSDNPIAIISENGKYEKSGALEYRWRSYSGNGGFYFYYDTHFTFVSEDFDWEKKSDKRRADKIMAEYKRDVNLIMLKKKGDKYYILVGNPKEEPKELEIVLNKAKAIEYFTDLRGYHQTPVHTFDYNTDTIEETYGDIRALYRDEEDGETEVKVPSLEDIKGKNKSGFNNP